MRKITRTNVAVSLLLLAVVMISTGCQTVNVKDREGNPIAFANVSSGVTGSETSSFSTITDAFGNAFLIKGNTENKKRWVAVSKEGYHPARISRSAEEKIKITLRKTTSSGQKYKRYQAASGRGKSETVNLRSPSSGTTPSKKTKVEIPRK